MINVHRTLSRCIGRSLGPKFLSVNKYPLKISQNLYFSKTNVPKQQETEPTNETKKETKTESVIADLIPEDPSSERIIDAPIKGSSFYNNLPYYVLYTVVIAGVVYLVVEDYRQNGNPITRSHKNFLEWLDELKNPVSGKQILPEQIEKKPTLVVAVEDFLVHSSFDPKAGWKTQKRPFADIFVHRLSQYYEVVLFSDNYLGQSVAQITEQLDPQGLTTKLFRDSTQYSFQNGVRGHMIKDLSKLGRSMEQVVMLEWFSDYYQGQEENTIVCKPWRGDVSDQYLLHLTYLFERVSTNKDLRSSVKALRELEGETAEEKVKSWYEHAILRKKK
ncbi:mitochondrial import inner membrane translocase subunit TIM50 [Acrasis kona]|uniref:Mitochondrial import inner membrane translocase subunit TIM50 n=1 Tax=Acrasis kona TaxID=1008807 RepID=A0AAW2ZM39_9EUKA